MKRVQSLLSPGLFLLLFIAAVFVAEIQLGATKDTSRLLQMGALNSSLVVDKKEYWRLFSHMFLHASLTHLWMNSLFAFAFLLNKRKAMIAQCLVFCAGGIFAGIVSICFFRLTGNYSDVSLGASAGLFACYGFYESIAIKNNWKNNQLKKSESGIIELATVLAIQSIVDIFTGGGTVAHISGCLFGVAVGLTSKTVELSEGRTDA